MLTPLLLLALAAPTTQPADEAELKMNDPVRQQAVEILDAAEPADPAERAMQAAAVLGDDWQAADKLRQIAGGGEGELTEVRDDLAFVPRDEAELPEGFPAPTPPGEMEIKTYPSYKMAVADRESVPEPAMFFLLFNHIQRNDIPMTAPVEMTMGEDGRVMQSMAFLYPSTDSPSPTGLVGNEELITTEPQKVVSLGIRGSRPGNVDIGLREKLQAFAAEQGYTLDGPMRVMGYNSPMVPRDQQFYEVQVPVVQE
jgi:hypothetical protein